MAHHGIPIFPLDIYKLIITSAVQMKCRRTIRSLICVDQFTHQWVIREYINQNSLNNPSELSQYIVACIHTYRINIIGLAKYIPMTCTLFKSMEFDFLNTPVLVPHAPDHNICKNTLVKFLHMNSMIPCMQVSAQHMQVPAQHMQAIKCEDIVRLYEPVCNKTNANILFNILEVMFSNTSDSNGRTQTPACVVQAPTDDFLITMSILLSKYIAAKEPAATMEAIICPVKNKEINMHVLYQYLYVVAFAVEFNRARRKYIHDQNNKIRIRKTRDVLHESDLKMLMFHEVIEEYTHETYLEGNARFNYRSLASRYMVGTIEISNMLAYLTINQLDILISVCVAKQDIHICTIIMDHINKLAAINMSLDNMKYKDVQIWIKGKGNVLL